MDNVIDGIIRNNRIYDFVGSNSDGIDIGENSEGILIATNLIYHAKDKGISVGQNSNINVPIVTELHSGGRVGVQIVVNGVVWKNSLLVVMLEPYLNTIILLQQWNCHK